jgi:hypothetical protein
LHPNLSHLIGLSFLFFKQGWPGVINVGTLSKLRRLVLRDGMSVAQGRAVMIYEDGTGKEHARQEIPYTDFPLNSITLYSCWDGEHWVIMLPSEY